jgi:AbrB family looped-hinge helix DNA binding protein
MSKEVAMVVQGKMTSKHQITLPVEVRKALGMKSGDSLTYDIGPDGQVVIRRSPRASELRGMLRSDVRLTDGDLVSAVDQARDAAGRGDRA